MPLLNTIRASRCASLSYFAVAAFPPAAAMASIAVPTYFSSTPAFRLPKRPPDLAPRPPGSTPPEIGASSSYFAAHRIAHTTRMDRSRARRAPVLTSQIARAQKDVARSLPDMDQGVPQTLTQVYTWARISSTAVRDLSMAAGVRPC